MKKFFSIRSTHITLSIILGVFSFWYLNYQVQRLAGWYIDDAGISFSYARNLLTGNLVHQAGATPVEGFSNPLWIFITAAAINILGSDISILRALSWLFIILVYLRMLLFTQNNSQQTFVFSVCFFLLAINPSIIIWCFSGLENSLYLLLGTELLLRLLSISNEINLRQATWAGMASAGLLLTRPDGVLYAPLFALVCFGLHTKNALCKWKTVAMSLLFPAIALFTYLTFRFLYFNDIFPNTYYAKGLPFTVRVFDFSTVSIELIRLLRELMQGCFSLQPDFLIFLPIGVLFFKYKKDNELIRILSPIAVFLMCSLFIYLYLPGDWMPELRFSTLVYLPLYLLVVTIIMRVPSNWKYIGLVTCLLFSIRGSVNRMNYFIENKPISISEVKYRNNYFTNWATKLNLEKPSILIADIGGALLDNTLTIVDLGMLCDRDIARSLGQLNMPPNREIFHQYVFSCRKPVFISTRAYHAWLANLDKDPRFRRDYVPIREYIDTWVFKRYGEVVYAGDYVRRDVVKDKNEVLASIRDEATNIYYPFFDKRIKSAFSND